MNSPYGLLADCHLRSDDFLCAPSSESLGAFNQIKHGVVFPEGAVIFAEGETPRGIFMLSQGQAKLTTTSRDGKTFILRIAKPGEILGLHSVVTDKPYDATVETMQPCQLNFVNREDFLRFLKEHSDACLQAAQQISRQCLDAYEVVRSIGMSHSVSRRVAKFLLASATDGQVRKGVVRVKLVLTHEEIAQVTGTSRESITRILSEFREKDIAELKGSTLTIHNKAALERLVAA
ncbi:MAG TPA: Crp/Fnr family transcriptional regulator [Candidatus Bathyarchaeia archaeon]|nr:Crp/Fnr family transcriptional regulator [Candidatus Bathyarchaeia archaeon]